jgi:hypothetical protein
MQWIVKQIVKGLCLARAWRLSRASRLLACDPPTVLLVRFLLSEKPLVGLTIRTNGLRWQEPLTRC